MKSQQLTSCEQGQSEQGPQIPSSPSPSKLKLRRQLGSYTEKVPYDLKHPTNEDLQQSHPEAPSANNRRPSCGF